MRTGTLTRAMTRGQIALASRRNRRGLSMLEYALMALIVLAVFGVLAALFTDFFSDFSERFGEIMDTDLPE
jgi:hypothetical protein